MMTLNDMMPIDSTLVKSASITCAEAFKKDPLTIYLIPDEKKIVKLPLGFEYLFRMSIAQKSELYTISRHCEGVAVWHDSRIKPPFDAVFRGGDLLIPFQFGFRFIIRSLSVDRFSAQIKRKFAPEQHMYLAWLAVHPDFQGKGYACLLLNQMLQRLDYEGLPCYLETQSYKNVSFYKHFGFRTVYSGEITDTGVPFFAMLRDVNTVPAMAFSNQLSASPA